MDCDVLVVGGGPVGLTLASELALQGHRVTLVESRHGPTNHLFLLPCSFSLNVRGSNILKENNYHEH